MRKATVPGCEPKAFVRHALKAQGSLDGRPQRWGGAENVPAALEAGYSRSRCSLRPNRSLVPASLLVVRVITPLR